MTPIPTPSRPDRRLRFEIRDILAVVVGYGMAAVFYRAFWPAAGPPMWVLAPAIILYTWLGLALSGPIILLRRRPNQPSAGEAVSTPAAPGVGTHTWAEWAWLFVGGYWVVLGIFVIPARLHKFAPSDALLFGLVPFLAALVSRLVGSDSRSARVRPAWTHAAAVWLLVTWPVAWACLVAVGRGIR